VGQAVRSRAPRPGNLDAREKTLAPRLPAACMTQRTFPSSRWRSAALLGAALLAGIWWASAQRAARAGRTQPQPRIPKKFSGGLPGAPQEPATYQQTLDEALAETFPASDPISPSQAMRAQDEAPSARDPVDWRVERGS
jgi:hypothetical protein